MAIRWRFHGLRGSGFDSTRSVVAVCVMTTSREVPAA